MSRIMQSASDEYFAERLHAALLSEIVQNTPSSDSASILAILRALVATWPDERAPYMTIVWGASFAKGGYGHRYGNSEELLKARLADPDDIPSTTIGSGFLTLRRNIQTLFCPQLEHSQIRWLDSAGDRQIVVLPAGYEL